MNKKFSRFMEIGCSGLAGVFVTIAYQYFFSQPQYQEQSITLNINGQEISFQTEDLQELTDRIVFLEIENRELKESNDELKNQEEAIPNIKVYDYDLLVNGVEESITSDCSVIEYNSHMYISYDILSVINEDIILNRLNNEIIVGNYLGEKCSLMSVCPPYEASISYSTNPFVMQGKTYSNGFSVYSSEYRYMLFNLENKYSSLEFDLGRVDGSSEYVCNINFYVDNEYVTAITKNPQDGITHEEIPLNYGTILRIEIITKNEPTASPLCSTYGLANMVLAR